MSHMPFSNSSSTAFLGVLIVGAAIAAFAGVEGLFEDMGDNVEPAAELAASAPIAAAPIIEATTEFSSDDDLIDEFEDPGQFDEEPEDPSGDYADQAFSSEPDPAPAVTTSNQETIDYSSAPTIR